MNRTKYPRTPHLPWSLGVSSDDRVQKDGLFRDRQVVVTLKMDGENTTWYSDYMHARSTTYSPHPSRDVVKALHAMKQSYIPAGYRIVGENLYAKHSIAYTKLPAYFLMFAVIDDLGTHIGPRTSLCKSWAETIWWSKQLGIPTVPVIYDGVFDRAKIEQAFAPHAAAHEGYVVRRHSSFHIDEFEEAVGKYVRANHVQTDEHWMRQAVVPNTLAPSL